MYNFDAAECCFYNSAIPDSLAQMDSFMTNAGTLASGERVTLPCYPEEVQESVRTNWASTAIIGRVGQMHGYNSTEDVSSSFSFSMHMEIFYEIFGLDPQSAEAAFNQCITALKSTAYPKYTSNHLQPPRTRFVFGAFKISGIVQDVQVTWKLPIIQKKYAVADVSISMLSAACEIIGTDLIVNNPAALRGHYFPISASY